MPGIVPRTDDSYRNDYSGDRYTVKTWLYDFAVFIFDVVFTIFFREIKVRGSQHVPPKNTPTILVCAPHANQFIDPSLVMSQTRKISGSSARQVCFVTAEGPMRKNKFVGMFGSWTGAIPVTRIQDNLEPVNAAIRLYTPDYENDPSLIKLVSVDPEVKPNAKQRFFPKSLIGLPDYLGNALIEEVVDDETIRLRKPFPDNQRVKNCVTNQTVFMYAEKIDNSKVFENVFNHLHTKGCVGIFPEGGSHDRPSLLPIKAGVAIMALGAVAADPTMEVHVVPCGLHYFHRHKFRSRATLEYAEPIIVTKEMGAEYLKDSKAAVASLLKKIEQSLYSVTVNADDYDTLMTVQAARRLYQPVRRDGDGEGERVPLSLVVEMNRRLLIGYSKYKDEPRIQHLKEAVRRYNSMLYSMGLKDHQVMKLRPSNEKWMVCLKILIRSFQVYCMVILSLPGVILFCPIFITCAYFSKKKAREGLKKSVVKLKGQDLLATWKIVVAITMAPTLYTLYSMIIIFLTRKYPYSIKWLIIPDFVFNHTILYFIYWYILLMITTYISFITGEIGMDTLKSFPPLLFSLLYPKKTWKRLRETRIQLSQEVTSVCNDLGPMVFPDLQKGGNHNDFYHKIQNKMVDPDTEDHDILSISSRSRSSSNCSTGSLFSNALSKVNSRNSLTDVPIFSEGSSNRDMGTQTSFDEYVDVEPIKQSKITSLIIEKRVSQKED